MEWVRGARIGRGSWGTVNMAIPTSQGTRFPPSMAVKSCGSSQSAMLLHEKNVLEQLGDCPALIQCFGGGLSFENGEMLSNLLLEYAAGGNLAEKIRSSGQCLPELDVRRYTKSILSGLKFIHENGFVHCDLKLQNVLLCLNNGREDAKIADFGLAKRAGERREKVGLDLRGTPLYMSPEMVAAGEQEAPADVWALGCLVVEMVTGEPAWKCSPENDVCRLLMRIAGEESPEIPQKLSEEGKDFLSKCFLKDPRKRWTAEMLLSHPFVAGDHVTSSPVNTCEATPSSSSPRAPFDFPDWDSNSVTSCWESNAWSSRELSTGHVTSSVTSPDGRLRRLATEQRPDWSDSDSWVRVR
ncbi:Mitogen-activated protein kinase kinase kinase [Bertholletia excelsa]